MKPLTVKKVTIQYGPNKGKSGWGITDGNKWHVHAFADKAEADRMALAIGDEEISRQVNVGYSEKMVMLLPSEPAELIPHEPESVEKITIETVTTEKTTDELVKDNALKRLAVMREIAIEKAEKEEADRVAREAENKEREKRIAIRNRELAMHENGMKDLIPFYVKDESHHGRDWWVFKVPGYEILYVSIKPRDSSPIVVRYMDVGGSMSNQYYTLGDALIAAKLD